MSSKFESNIWKFYLYKFIRGLWLPATIWILYVLARGLSYGQIGMTEIVFAAVVLLLEIPSGAFADIIGRKYSVFLGYTIIAFSVFMIGLAHEYIVFILLLALQGVGDTLYSGADNALLFDSLKTSKKEKIYAEVSGKGGAFFSMGSVLGGFIGAYLYTINISYPFFVGGFMFFLAGLTFLFMEEPSKVHTKYTVKKHYRQIIDGCKDAHGRPKVRWIVAFASLIAALFFYQVFIVSASLEGLGFKVKYFGFLFALIWGFEASVYWNAHKVLKFLGEKKTLFLIPAIHIICFIVLSFLNNWLGLIFIIINYWGRGLYYPITENYIQKHIKSSHRATTLSVENFGVSLITLITIGIFSRLTDYLSINKVYLIVGITIFASTIILYATFPYEEK